MAKRLPNYLPRTINQHVPLMTFAADVIDGVHIVNLGAPATADPNGIVTAEPAGAAATTNTGTWATTFDGSSTSLTTTSGKLDTNFGRCLTMVGTAGSDHVITVRGRDYLGQPMRENFTLNGTTTQYGEKAFMYVDQLDTAAGAAGDTYAVGWDDRLGLPYAAQNLLSWTEDEVRKDLGTYQIAVDIVDAVAADTVFGVGGEAGFVTRMDTITSVALGAGDAVLTVEIGGTAVTGLSVTVASSGSAIGVLDGDAAGDDHGATTKLGANAAIEVVSDGGSATTGTVDARITVDKNAFFIDRDTTTATATTGDTRGTVQPHTSCNGSIVFEARYQVDLTSLHGLAQFNG